jgi:hypothetical protein
MDIDAWALEVLSNLEELYAANGGDTEAIHVLADGYLCDFLRVLGYNNIVDAYESLEKWYA